MSHAFELFSCGGQFESSVFRWIDVFSFRGHVLPSFVNNLRSAAKNLELDLVFPVANRVQGSCFLANGFEGFGDVRRFLSR